MFKNVFDDQSLKLFLEDVDYLHDALIREISMISRGYVDANGWMHGDTEPNDARLIIQSQNKTSPAVEVVLEEIFRFRLNFSLELEGQGEAKVDRIVIYPSGRANAEESIFEAKSLKYRLLGKEFLGSELRTVSSISDSS